MKIGEGKEAGRVVGPGALPPVSCERDKDGLLSAEERS